MKQSKQSTRKLIDLSTEHDLFLRHRKKLPVRYRDNDNFRHFVQEAFREKFDRMIAIDIYNNNVLNGGDPDA